jgi:hypothetical protein
MKASRRGSSVDEDRHGLTLEEREHLTARTSDVADIDLKMSLLAFASLLLICALIFAASVISRKHVPRENTPSSQSVSPPAVVSTVPANPEPDLQEQSTPLETSLPVDLPDETISETPHEDAGVGGNTETETFMEGP